MAKRSANLRPHDYSSSSACDPPPRDGGWHKWEHQPPQIVGDLLEGEIAEKQARSIKYSDDHRQTPLAKDNRRLWLGRHDRSTKPWCVIFLQVA